MGCCASKHDTAQVISAEEVTKRVERPVEGSFAMRKMSTATQGQGVEDPGQSMSMMSRTYSTPLPAWLPKAVSEQEAGLSRLGINSREVMAVLRKELWESFKVPMHLMMYGEFVFHKSIPRSTIKKTRPLSEIPGDCHIVLVSFPWLRPGRHPDDVKGTMHSLICSAVEKLSLEMGWDLANTSLWLDYCSVNQDSEGDRASGLQSMRAFVTAADAVIIPSVQVPAEGDARFVHLLPGGLGECGWTRLVGLGAVASQKMRQREPVQLWVAAGDKASFFERYGCVVGELPSEGVFSDPGHKELVREHEDVFVRGVKALMQSSGYVASHSGAARCVAVSAPGGDFVMSGGDDGVISMVRRDVGTVHKTFVGHEGGILCMAMSKDGRRLASAGSDRTIRVWDVESGKESIAPITEHSEANKACTCNHSGGDNGDEYVEDEDCPVTGHSDYVRCLSFSPDCQYLASCSDDRSVKVLFADTGLVKATLKGHTRDNPECTCEFFPSGLRKELNRECAVEGHNDCVMSVAWSLSGSTVASASKDTTVKVWDFGRSGAVKGSLIGHDGEVTSVAWSPTLEDMLVSGGADGSLRLWDGKLVREAMDPWMGHKGPVCAVSFAPDGEKVVSGGADGTVRVWDRVKGTDMGTVTQHSGRVWALAWSPDGQWVGSCSEDGTVRMGDMTSGVVQAADRPHSDRVMDLAISRNADMAASASDTAIVLWDALTGDKMATIDGQAESVRCVAWSPEEDVLAIANDNGTIVVFDTATGQERGRVEAHCKENQECRCTHKPRTEEDRGYEKSDACPVVGHSDSIYRLAWSPHGEFIASASDDGTVRIWNAATCHPAMAGCMFGSPEEWTGVEAECKRVATRAMRGEEDPNSHCRSGAFVVTAVDEMVVVIQLPAHGATGAEPLAVASFQAHSRVGPLCCSASNVIAGCEDGRVLFLEAPFMSP